MLIHIKAAKSNATGRFNTPKLASVQFWILCICKPVYIEEALDMTSVYSFTHTIAASTSASAFQARSDEVVV